MRNRLLVLGLFGIVTAAYFSFQKLNSDIQPEYGPSPVSSTTTVKPSLSSNAGAKKHEIANHRSRKQNGNPRKSQRTSGTSPEVQGLPSLYETSQRGTVGDGARDSRGTELESESLDSDSLSPEATGPKVIAGVPVALWVEQNQNRLRTAEVSPEADQSLRVFVGCIEMKKNPQVVGKSQCQSMQIAHQDEMRPNSRLIR